MNQDTKYRFIAIVVFSLICVYIVAPIPNKPAIPIISDAKLKLGIDLDGGAELRYRVLYGPEHAKGERKALTQKATDVIRHRIEQKKTLTEAKINAQGDDEIVIQLPGVDQSGLQDFKRLVDNAGKLELYAVAPKDVQERYNEAREKSPEAPPPAGYKVWKNAERHQSTGEYAAFSKDWILLETKPIIDGDHLTKADPQQTMGGLNVSWVTSFELNAEGAKLFDEAAVRLYNQKPPGLIAIVLDDIIQSAPVVQSESFHGRGQISGAGKESEALDLAIVLRSGKLPARLGSFNDKGEAVPKKPESELFVGPTLGEDAIRRGLLASGATIALVALFMLVYYRKAGFVAVTTLALNMVYLLAIMSFFHATMTLPGIAGIVLTVGMAVDANILIYERIREEQAKGKTASQAYEAGHERAFSSIVDANVTTLVAALVLYWFGTGPVQGFAVSLSIGIATTLFSVLVCGKTFLKMMVVSGTTEFRMMKLMSDPKLDYLKVARVCVIGSTLMVTAGMLFVGVRGQKSLGIDFRGGSMLSFAMNQPQEIEAVRAKVLSIKGKDGTAKFGDAEMQTVGDTGAEKPVYGLSKGASRNFQLRTAFTGIQEIKDDLQEAFKDTLSHEPFGEMQPAEADPNPRKLPGGVGQGWWIYVQESAALENVKQKVAASLKDVLEKNDAGEPAFLLSEAPGAPKGLKKLKFEVPKKNAEEVQLRAMREKLKGALAGELAKDPFLSQGSIGPAVAARLVDDSFWAMLVSWVLMILYIAFRFDSWKYGVAAVAALIHDALIAIAFTALAGVLIPKSWGLSFEMNLTSLAAILTIIGYSINDTIVIFDRIRENLKLMKKATFAEIINTSVNQTMSRTILTSFTVWISALVLYIATMNTGGGIAEFAFPLIVGVIAGTYSTIYIASPILLWWYKGQRPAST